MLNKPFFDLDLIPVLTFYQTVINGIERNKFNAIQLFSFFYILLPAEVFIVDASLPLTSASKVTFFISCSPRLLTCTSCQVIFLLWMRPYFKISLHWPLCVLVAINLAWLRAWKHNVARRKCLSSDHDGWWHGREHIGNILYRQWSDDVVIIQIMIKNSLSNNFQLWNISFWLLTIVSFKHRTCPVPVPVATSTSTCPTWDKWSLAKPFIKECQVSTVVSCW